MMLQSVIKTRILILLIFILGFNPIFAQQEDADTNFVFNPIVEDITDRIPPLQTLIDSALQYSPLMRQKDATVDLGKYNYLTQKRQLLSNIAFNGNVTYGYSGIYSTTDNVTSTIDQYMQRADWRYNVGATLRISIYDLVNRSNLLNITRKNWEIAVSQKEEQIFAIRKEVTFMYNDLLLKQKLLKIASDNMLTSKMRMVMAEKKFINNQLSLEEMSRLMEYNSSVQMEYETRKNDFMNTYTLLELTTGIKFNALNKID
ncbi:MAG TPA: TolC family protein [Bacteroidales bacterium]|jgi:outer membrane protein TolC|nr:TolC family protein [Bacteroidales bacterium]